MRGRVEITGAQAALAERAFWNQDSAAALRAAEQQMREAGITDEAFFIALADVNFQLGTGWTKKHKKTWDLILRGNYDGAAKEAADSVWYEQTPARVQAFQAALRALASKRKRQLVRSSSPR